MIVRVNGSLAAKRGTGDLTAAVRNHLVDVHVELSAAAGHPNVQRKHIVVLASEDFVADLHDQFAPLILKPLAGIICYGGSLFQRRIGCYHFARNEIVPNAEMLQGALGLRPPKLVRWNLDDTETVAFFSDVGHFTLLCLRWEDGDCARDYRHLNQNAGL